MKLTLKNHLYCLFAYVVSFITSFLIGNTIILTIYNAILKSESKALFATQITMRLLVPVCAFILIYIYKRNNREEYKIYTSQMKEKNYDVKDDFNKLLKDKNLWAEVIFVSVITFVYWIMHYMFVWILLNIPIFLIFELSANISIHKYWLKEKS